jgi:ABC-type lipoprotein export system ATPase subunit
MKEQFADLVTDLKALKNASPWAAAQLGKKAMVKAAQCMEGMINHIEALEKRIEELEGGNRGES